MCFHIHFSLCRTCLQWYMLISVAMVVVNVVNVENVYFCHWMHLTRGTITMYTSCFVLFCFSFVFTLWSLLLSIEELSVFLYLSDIDCRNFLKLLLSLLCLPRRIWKFQHSTIWFTLLVKTLKFWQYSVHVYIFIVTVFLLRRQHFALVVILLPFVTHCNNTFCIIVSKS